MWLDTKGFTQTEFAERCGWSQRMVSHWCNGDRYMSVEAMYTASVELKIRMEALYEWVEIEAETRE